MYTRGARRLAEARTSDRAEVYHDWRKRAKYLRYALELVGPAWPSVLGAHENELHTLTDLLGDGNDATQLASVSYFTDTEPTQAAEGMRDLIHTYRADLWTQALGLGSRLYAERPRGFTARVCAYCDAWWRDGAAPMPG
jgi:CHAD domain-containing protein